MRIACRSESELDCKTRAAKIEFLSDGNVIGTYAAAQVCSIACNKGRNNEAFVLDRSRCPRSCARRNSRDGAVGPASPKAKLSQPYAYEPKSNWNNRGIADPSFGNRAGINNARTYNRCVIDLGYGRYEYCN